LFLLFPILLSSELGKQKHGEMDNEEHPTGGTTADAIVAGGEPTEVGSGVEEPWWWGEAVEEALKCPICVDVLRDAVETNCCHGTYCRCAPFVCLHK
jgi:hypothetical protein